ncbi:MAG TPA: efflux RND transporter periplasmic adaptor subunit [Polyangiaceae bacterium]|nr:efflux RND transporter periplasmic adaptor subunit [Polyangiaceae bacterium]
MSALRCSLGGVCLTALFGCHAQTAKEEESPKVAVHCVTPQLGALDETIALRGRLAAPPGGDLPVASQVPGRIVQVDVREGQRVSKGDLVARVDEASSRDAVRQAEAAIAQAEASEINARATLERVTALVTKGIAAKQELDDARAHEDSARATVAAAEASGDLARRTLGRVLIHSSFDGVVTRLWRGPGAIVDGTAATPIIQLAAAHAVEFVADAIDRDLAEIAEGQPAKVELSMGGPAVTGTVRARSSALDVVTGLGVVRIAIDKPEATFPIGAFGRAVVTTRHRDAVALLPTTALRGAVSDGAELVLCKDGKAELREVKIGWRDEKRFEPIEGVGSGDRIAIDHVLGLDDGTELVEAK